MHLQIRNLDKIGDYGWSKNDNLNSMLVQSLLIVT